MRSYRLELWFPLSYFTFHRKLSSMKRSLIEVLRRMPTNRCVATPIEIQVLCSLRCKWRRIILSKGSDCLAVVRSCHTFLQWCSWFIVDVLSTCRWRLRQLQGKNAFGGVQCGDANSVGATNLRIGFAVNAKPIEFVGSLIASNNETVTLLLRPERLVSLAVHASNRYSLL